MPLSVARWPGGGLGSQDTANLKMIPFGKHLPREEGIEYLIATGIQECMLCQAIVSEAYVGQTTQLQNENNTRSENRRAVVRRRNGGPSGRRVRPNSQRSQARRCQTVLAGASAFVPGTSWVRST